jgi:hypothetical protein
MPVVGTTGEVPLSPEIVEGWRAWSVVEERGELRLSSLTRADPWEPLQPFGARCSRRDHDAPGRACACGVYAASRPEELAGLGRIAGAAIGQVSLWGRVAQHRRGYRAATAYPARLRLVCVECLGRGRGVPASRIDRDGSPSRPRLVPLCAAHAAGRSLPSARPVEQRLLSTYGVEMVPDAAVERIRPIPRGDARRRRRGAVAAAALLLVVTAATLRLQAQRAVSPSPVAVPQTSQRTSGVELPLNRTNDGLISTPRIRILLLTPTRFDAPRCGMRATTGVRRVECADPRADVFIEDVGPAGADREGTCSDATAIVTSSRDRLLCWRLLP